MATAALVQLHKPGLASLQNGYERRGNRPNRPHYEDADQYEYWSLAHSRLYERPCASKPSIHQAASTSQSLNQISDNTSHHRPHPKASQQATLASLSETFLGVQQRQDCITRALQELSWLMRNIKHSMQARNTNANIGAIEALPAESSPLNEVQDTITPGNRLDVHGDKWTGDAPYGNSCVNEIRRFTAQKQEKSQSTFLIHSPHITTSFSDRSVDTVTVTTDAATQSSGPTQTYVNRAYRHSVTQGVQWPVFVPISNGKLFWHKQVTLLPKAGEWYTAVCQSNKEPRI